MPGDNHAGLELSEIHETLLKALGITAILIRGNNWRRSQLCILSHHHITGDEDAASLLPDDETVSCVSHHGD